MVGFLIAAHGQLSKGLKSSVQVIMGTEIAEKIQTITAFLDNDMSNPKTMVETACEAVNADDELIVFTDIMHGSVNQFFMPFAKDNIYVISGVNLPLICEVIAQYAFSPAEAKVDPDQLREIVEQAKEAIVYVNDAIETGKDAVIDSNEEEFFN